MEANNLIKKRISELKEKELRKGLETDERLELGRLYITDEINDAYELVVIQNNKNYWKTRCLLLETFIAITGGFHKLVTTKNIKEYNDYKKFINSNKQPK